MVIQSKRVWISGGFYPAQLLLESGKIVRVLPYGEMPAGEDYGDKRIIPGFIDTHTHGAYGADANFSPPEDIAAWAMKAPSEGITSFLPSTSTQSDEVLTLAAKNISAARKLGRGGAEILGIHFEGPYLGTTFKGAQTEQFIVKADIAQFDRWQDAAGGMIKLVTVAPEEDCGFEFIRYAVESGVTVSMGHSAATLELAVLAAANGANSVTHTHNGMSPYSHKSPGMVNAALSCKDVYAEIIPDGVHVPFPLVRSLFECKGKHHAVVVTDSLFAKGMAKGEASFDGFRVVLGENGAAYLKDTGTLAGSTLRFADGLRNLVEYALVPFDAALNACTINPARRIGAEGYKGKLAAGYDADIVVLGDDYTVLQTYCRGGKSI